MTNKDAMRIYDEEIARGGSADSVILRTIGRAVEACAIAAWVAGMDAHNKALGLPCDAREVGAAAASAIRMLSLNRAQIG